MTTSTNVEACKKLAAKRLLENLLENLTKVRHLRLSHPFTRTSTITSIKLKNLKCTKEIKKKINKKLTGVKSSRERTSKNLFKSKKRSRICLKKKVKKLLMNIEQNFDQIIYSYEGKTPALFINAGGNLIIKKPKIIKYIINIKDKNIFFYAYYYILFQTSR